MALRKTAQPDAGWLVRLQRRVNTWVQGLSPWGLAVLLASVVAGGVALGSASGRLVAGEGISGARVLAIAAVTWFGLVLLGRLTAPVVLASMRQQARWREERERAARGPAGSSGAR